jgi:hypothetical protein
MADIENADNFITDSELNRYINMGLSELWDLLIEAMGHEFYLAVSTLSCSSANGNGNGKYSIPCDVVVMRRVEVVGDNNYRYEARPANMHDLRSQDGDDLLYRAGFTHGEGGVRYRLMGEIDRSSGGWTQQIQISPYDWTGTLNLYYVPNAPTLDDDEDVFNGVNGWEDYICVDAAIRCLEKEESDTAALQIRKNKLEQRIRTIAEARDDGWPEVIADVERYR